MKEDASFGLSRREILKLGAGAAAGSMLGDSRPRSGAAGGMDAVAASWAQPP